MKLFKSGFLLAICALIFMASCSKENIIPVGTLGDPKDPGNGLISTTQYSSSLVPIPPQREESGGSMKNLSSTYGEKTALSGTNDVKTN